MELLHSLYQENRCAKASGESFIRWLASQDRPLCATKSHQSREREVSTLKTINGGMRHTLFTHMVPMCVCFKCTYILSKVSLHPEMEERISSVSRERESVKKGGEKGERGSRAIVVAQLLPSCFCSMSVHSHHDFGWWGFFLPLCFLLNFGYRCYCKSSMTKPQRKKKAVLYWLRFKSCCCVFVSV